MRRHLFLALMAVAVSAFVFSASPSQAVHKNYDSLLACGSCHTMHNSQGNTTLGGAAGGSIVLLRGAATDRSTIHNLCLQCHASNGAQGDNVFGSGASLHPAPKVYLDGQLGCGATTAGSNYCAAYDAGKIGAGGDFSLTLAGNSTGWATVTEDDTVAIGYGHSLGQADPLPPGSANSTVGPFSCTSCHDPHGAYQASTAAANEYRNLRPIPVGSGESTDVTFIDNLRSYVGMGDCGSAADADWETGVYDNNLGANAGAIWPVYRPGAGFTASDTSECSSVGSGTGAAGSVNSYAISGLGTVITEGIAAFCAACHDDWHEGNVVANGPDANGDWRRHPVDNRITGDAKSTSGAGVEIIDLANYQLANGRALPVATTQSTALYYLQSIATADSDENKVFCLSCHFAHAGPYFDNLRWDYLAGVEAGDQTANSLASNVGCQQCHNR